MGQVSRAEVAGVQLPRVLAARQLDCESDDLSSRRGTLPVRSESSFFGENRAGNLLTVSQSQGVRMQSLPDLFVEIGL